MPRDGVWAARAAHEAAIFSRANVVGLAVGKKVIRGRETDEPCVVVFVEHKFPEDALRRRDIVPKTLDGVRTDVVETGRFEALPVVQATDVDRTNRMRPAPGGVSIGHVRITAGTLGVLVHRHGRPVILSNNHVLANMNRADLGDAILQPGPADGGRPQDSIARLVEFVPIQFNERNLGPLGGFLERLLSPILGLAGLALRRLPSGRSNLVDAAVAEPTDAALVAPDVLGVGPVSGMAPASLDLRVRKSGRTTGVTEGRITAVDAVVEVDYGGLSAMFREQLVSDLVSKGGDSGSLVVDPTNRAVGLLFAGSPTTTLINPIAAVARALDLNLE